MFEHSSDRHPENNNSTGDEVSNEDLDDFDFEFDEHFEAESADEWTLVDDPYPEEVALRAVFNPDRPGP